MKKKMIKSLLTIACLLCSISASAYDFEVDGLQYDIVSSSDLTCKLVGTLNENGFVGDVIIPDHVDYEDKTLTVVGIKDSLFKENDITGITIPNTISYIGDYMFNGCTKLERVKFEDGESVLKLGNGSITTGNGDSEKEGLFTSCPVKFLYIGRNLSYLNYNIYGFSPFCRNKTITDVTISNSVTEIGDYAFSDCKNLEIVKIEDGETKLYLYYPFSGCPIKSLYIGRDYFSKSDFIGDFREKEKIKEVTIGNSVTEIGNYAFSGCSGLTSLKIGNSVKTIGWYAFRNCSSLTSVTIGNSVTKICGYAFQDCSGITSLTIPNSVTEIGDYAFYSCSGITSLTIPNSVKKIGRAVFDGCSGITSLTIPNSVTEIGDYAFSGCSGITSLTIPNSVTRIGSSAFEGCSGITSLTIPNSVTRIGSSAFEGCSGITSLTIPNSVTRIGSSAFEGCSGITSLTIPNSVTRIGSSAFFGCSGITSLTISNSVTEIGDYAFYSCSGITSLTIPNSVTRIGSSAFFGCSGITSLTIPNSVTEIGNFAFYECSGITSLTIPNSVTRIGDRAFEGCEVLTELYSLNPTPPYIYLDTFTTNQYMTMNVYVPEEALQVYQEAGIWKNFWNLHGFDPTDIKGVENDGVNGVKKYYDLRGNKLETPKRGINIINGKKVAVK